MTQRLRLRSVHARWVTDETKAVRGHNEQQPVDCELDAGEWIGIVGRNGVGKSTLLHAIAGAAPFVWGSVEVDDVHQDPADPWICFLSGVGFVTQHAELMPPDHAPLTVADARNLAIASRPALNNEPALRDALGMMASFGWISNWNDEEDDDKSSIEPRLFDLVVAMLSLPRVLLLDEVIGTWAQAEQCAERYREIRLLAPHATVLFTDHAFSRAVEVADRVLWLHSELGGAPEMVVADRNAPAYDVERMGELKTALGQLDTVSPKTHTGRRSSAILSPECFVIDELASAARAKMPWGQRRAWLRSISRRAPFLRERKPVCSLSGGQQIVLAAILLDAVDQRLDSTEFVHLDPASMQLVHELHLE